MVIGPYKSLYLKQLAKLEFMVFIALYTVKTPRAVESGQHGESFVKKQSHYSHSSAHHGKRAAMWSSTVKISAYQVQDNVPSGLGVIFVPKGAHISARYFPISGSLLI